MFAELGLIVSVIFFLGVAVSGFQTIIHQKWEEKEKRKFYLENLPKVQRTIDVMNSCKTSIQLYYAYDWAYSVVSKLKAPKGVGVGLERVRFYRMVDFALENNEENVL